MFFFYYYYSMNLYQNLTLYDITLNITLYYARSIFLLFDVQKKEKRLETDYKKNFNIKNRKIILMSLNFEINFKLLVNIFYHICRFI